MIPKPSHPRFRFPVRMALAATLSFAMVQPGGPLLPRRAWGLNDGIQDPKATPQLKDALCPKMVTDHIPLIVDSAPPPPWR